MRNPYPSHGGRVVERITDKQYRILSVVLEGNRDAEGRFTPVDIDQLLERLSYRTTKQSFYFSMKALVARGLVEKGEDVRRGARRVTLAPTERCRRLFSHQASSPAYLDPVGLDIV